MQKSLSHKMCRLVTFLLVSLRKLSSFMFLGFVFFFFFFFQELEGEGQLHQAEHHFLEARDWKAAVNMYRNQDLREEAYRVSYSLMAANYARSVYAHFICFLIGSESPFVPIIMKFYSDSNVLRVDHLFCTTGC